MSGWDVKENIVDTNVYKTDGSVTTQSLRVLSEEATSWQQIASRALNYAAIMPPNVCPCVLPRLCGNFVNLEHWGKYRIQNSLEARLLKVVRAGTFLPTILSPTLSTAW
jgi:hypothetical protein